MSWTEQNYRDFMSRRLKDSERAREAMFERAIKTHVKAKNQALSAKSGYNTAVVLAWFHECGLPQPVMEFQFDPSRRWRFDFGWPKDMGMPGYGNADLALEVQGGLFSGGAHVRGAALLKEHCKLNRAAVLGWRVMFTTPQDLCTKDLADQIKQALGL